MMSAAGVLQPVSYSLSDLISILPAAASRCMGSDEKMRRRFLKEW